MNAATAFAPATVANVAAGFDVLGFALEAPGDRATVTRIDGAPGPVVGVVVGTIRGVADVPVDPARNTAAVALRALLRAQGLRWTLRVDLHKGIPLGSGLGGSAASAVAAVVAGNALLPAPRPLAELLPFALEGEAAASGSAHADNAAPCLLGGLRAALPAQTPEGPPLAIAVPVPRELWCAVALPDARIDTKDARAALAPTVPLPAFVRQSAHLCGLVAGCFAGDYALIARCLRDEVIEPQRRSRIPAFAELVRAALAAGALGASISGSGPAVFAWTRGQQQADAVLAAMRGVAGAKLRDGWISPVGAPGARLLEGPCAG